MEVAGVTVSPAELMAVKEEESSGDDHGAGVVLHLQPILHGMKGDMAETGTTVLAIETHHDESKADGEEVEYGYPITCGDSRAVLLFKKFVCPGINVRCVKFNEQLISPKQFVHLAGKATLKDWKRAIRLGGVMLRKMMDSGQIDFYQHDSVCSNTCRSTKFDVLINSSRLPPPPPLPPGMAAAQPGLSALALLDPPGGQVPLLTEIIHDAAEVEETLVDRFNSAAAAEWSLGPARHVQPATANGHGAKRKRADTPDSGTLSLWKAVADSGLMGDVLSSLQTELSATFKGVRVRGEKGSLQETDAVVLNTLCEMFGLLDSVKQALDLRRGHSEESKFHDALSETLDERMKLGCDSGAYKSVSSRHPRTHRHQPSINHMHGGVLSPAETNPLLQALSLTGLSAASYAQLSVHPQLLTQLSASAGQHHHGRSRRSRERGGRQEQEEKQRNSGICREPGARTGQSQEDAEFRRGEGAGEQRDLQETETVMTGRKSKKHKRKSE